MYACMCVCLINSKQKGRNVYIGLVNKIIYIGSFTLLRVVYKRLLIMFDHIKYSCLDVRQ